MTAMPSRNVRVPVFITRQLRGLIEFVLASSVMAVLVVLALPSIALYVERAHVTEALIGATVIKQELTAMRSTSGRWPLEVRAPIPAKQDGNRSAATVQYEEAAFTMVLKRRDAIHRVSFRAATVPAQPRAPVLWLCGYAAVPAGVEVVAPNRTDIPMAYLPQACRGPL